MYYYLCYYSMIITTKMDLEVLQRMAQCTLRRFGRTTELGKIFVARRKSSVKRSKHSLLLCWMHRTFPLANAGLKCIDGEDTILPACICDQNDSPIQTHFVSPLTTEQSVLEMIWFCNAISQCFKMQSIAEYIALLQTVFNVVRKPNVVERKLLFHF